MEKKQLAEIGHRLRQKRNELSLTREQMAELADIGVGFYGQLEVGTSQMSWTLQKKCSDTLQKKLLEVQSLLTTELKSILVSHLKESQYVLYKCEKTFAPA